MSARVLFHVFRLRAPDDFRKIVRSLTVNYENIKDEQSSTTVCLSVSLSLRATAIVQAFCFCAVVLWWLANWDS